MSENVSNEKPIKNRKRLSILFNIFIVLLSVIALAIAGILIYQKRYLSPFWVNGQSMYPTLNKNAIKPDGTPAGIDTKITEVGSKKVDYGVADKHERALKNLKRFDIVITHYRADDKVDKIKRLVGLPGETIKFGQIDTNDNGTLYIKKGDQFVVQEQPISNEYITAGVYPSGEITLKDNEYYVLGDNRGNSSDSRGLEDPIKFEWLVGKVVALCAYCEIAELPDGSVGPTNIAHYFPRFL